MITINQGDKKLIVRLKQFYNREVAKFRISRGKINDSLRDLLDGVIDEYEIYLLNGKFDSNDLTAAKHNLGEIFGDYNLNKTGDKNKTYDVVLEAYITYNREHALKTIEKGNPSEDLVSIMENYLDFRRAILVTDEDRGNYIQAIAPLVARFGGNGWYGNNGAEGIKQPFESVIEAYEKHKEIST